MVEQQIGHAGRVTAEERTRSRGRECVSRSARFRRGDVR
jgi:hypothetical protein